MKKNIQSFAISDSKAFRIKMLNWSSRFNIFCFLDNCNYAFDTPAFEFILAVGCTHSLQLKSNDPGSLKKFSAQNKDWLFGHLGYEALSQHPHTNSSDEYIDFGPGFFFIPQHILSFNNNELTIETDENVQEIFNGICKENDHISPGRNKKISLQQQITRDAFINNLVKIKQHILRGDCYELNYCQHFFAKDAMIDPLSVYHSLTQLSPNPFSAFYKLNHRYCLCASPERFIQRQGNRVTSQPIKGTSKRELSDAAADEANRNYLLTSEKERSENVMIVDLVRNDLSKVCMEGSVKVTELFGLYSFPQVHQMISTVEGEVAPGTSWVDIVEACFPMGSMTGAPKKKVMELISRYEPFTRGLFSGSIGYVAPTGDFDFNVVIRSLFYDEIKKLISFKAGGGITFNSNVEEEYEESLLKVSAIMKVLAN